MSQQAIMSIKRMFDVLVLFNFLSLSAFFLPNPYAEAGSHPQNYRWYSNNEYEQFHHYQAQEPIGFQRYNDKELKHVKHAAQTDGALLLFAPNQLTISAPHSVFNIYLDGAAEKTSYKTLDRFKKDESYFKYEDERFKHKTAYENIGYRNVYPQVDTLYYGDHRYDQQYLEQNFIVQPGGDPSIIKLRFDQIKKIEIIDGYLIIYTDSGDFTCEPPYGYQRIDDKMHPVPVSYAYAGDDTVALSAGGYDPNYPLIINPTLRYPTYPDNRYDYWQHYPGYDKYRDDDRYQDREYQKWYERYYNSMKEQYYRYTDDNLDLRYRQYDKDYDKDYDHKYDSSRYDKYDKHIDRYDDRGYYDRYDNQYDRYPAKDVKYDPYYYMWM